ncbi:MAG: OB-fold nucleic acid binding domain-containing protein, partial [Nitriliruptorales bacterium]|nr:OB-fold nucleic acid binding domain-containing protein [Nitriliruptorales bacterium]
AMVETFQARMAIREVGKVLGLPPDEIGHVAKSFTHARARDVRRALDALPELRGTRMNAGQLDRLFEIVERIDGFPRHLALHPCGILMASLQLQDVTPLERSARGYPMAQFDKDDVAALGLLKLDVLGVRMLSAMRHAMTLIPQTRGHPFDVEDIPSGDRATYELICSARTVGMFQIESPGQQELVGRLRPEDFGDLITEISLFRPGPVKADMVTPYVNRHRNGEKAQYMHPALVPVLKETHGVVVYHEQVMGVISALTGCDMSYADLLRRQLNDDRKLPAMRAWAVARGVDRGFSREEAEHVWKQVASFASFGFCKAHAAAFAVPTYRSAYLKAHYLPELMAGILTHDPGMYPRRLILDDCRTFGVAILPVDINRSESHYTVEVIDRGRADRLLGVDQPELPPGWRRAEDGELRPPSGFDAGDAGDGWRYAIRCGLQDVKGINRAEIDSVLDRRPFPSLEDVRVRANLSRPVAERLADLGAFDHVAGLGRPGGPANRRQLRLVVEESWAAGERGRRRAREGTEQTSLDLHADHVAALPSPTGADQVRAEIAHAGLDVTRHVVSFYEPLLDALGVIRASELEDQPAQKVVRVAGVKVAVQSPSQRSGQRVLFLSLDDRTGMTQVTFFERHLTDCAWTILHSWLVVTEGRITRRGQRGATVAGTRAWDLSRLWRAWQQGWLPDALEEKGTPAPHQRQPVAADGLRASQWGRGA